MRKWLKPRIQPWWQKRITLYSRLNGFLYTVTAWIFIANIPLMNRHLRTPDSWPPSPKHRLLCFLIWPQLFSSLLFSARPQHTTAMRAPRCSTLRRCISAALVLAPACFVAWPASSEAGVDQFKKLLKMVMGNGSKKRQLGKEVLKYTKYYPNNKLKDEFPSVREAVAGCKCLFLSCRVKKMKSQRSTGSVAALFFFREGGVAVLFQQSIGTGVSSMGPLPWLLWGYCSQ